LPKRERLKPESKQKSKRRNAVRLLKKKPKLSLKEDLKLKERMQSLPKKLMKLKSCVWLKSKDVKRNDKQHMRSLWRNNV